MHAEPLGTGLEGPQGTEASTDAMMDRAFASEGAVPDVPVQALPEDITTSGVLPEIAGGSVPGSEAAGLEQASLEQASLEQVGLEDNPLAGGLATPVPPATLTAITPPAAILPEDLSDVPLVGDTQTHHLTARQRRLVTLRTDHSVMGNKHASSHCKTAKPGDAWQRQLSCMSVDLSKARRILCGLMWELSQCLRHTRGLSEGCWRPSIWRSERKHAPQQGGQ